MVGTSSPTSSSSSSCLSIGSFVDDASTKSSTTTIKFLCSYGGRIVPRCTDGKLRYVGGDTRVLSVDRSISFSELVARMGELCGWGAAVSLRCQMPTEDLDALVSITSDEDLASLIEEYDLAGGGVHLPKIRAFLHHPPPPPTPPSSKGKSASASASASRPPPVPTTVHRCVMHHSRAPVAGRTGHGSQRVQHHHQHHHHQQHQFPVHHHREP